MGSYAGPISLLPLDPMGSYAGPISLLPLDPRLHKPRVSSWGPEPKTPLAVTSSLRIRFLSASPRPTTSRTASVPSSTLSHGAHVLEKEHLEKRPPPGASPAAGASVSCTRLGMPQLTHYFPRETARPPRGPLATSADLLGHPQWGADATAGPGPGRCYTSCNVQDGPLNRESPRPEGQQH